MGEGSRVEVKNNYYLFMDGSSSSKEVEKRLRDVGIDFIRVQERGGVLPRLTGPEGSVSRNDQHPKLFHYTFSGAGVRYNIA